MQQNINLTREELVRTETSMLILTTKGLYCFLVPLEALDPDDLLLKQFPKKVTVAGQSENTPMTPI